MSEQLLGPLLLDVESMSREQLIAFVRNETREKLCFLDKLSKDEVFDLARMKNLAVWESEFTVRKWHDAEVYEDTLLRAPDEEVIKRHNLLMYGGVSCLWEALIGNGTASAGQALTYFNNANAAVGVGDSTTSPAATQTDLQASTNKVRVGMVATYPQHTDATTSGAATIVFQSSFPASGGTAANFAWNECGVFNSSTAATGRMLNRLAPGGGFGTKAGGVWSLTVSLTIS